MVNFYPITWDLRMYAERRNVTIKEAERNLKIAPLIFYTHRTPLKEVIEKLVHNRLIVRVL